MPTTRIAIVEDSAEICDELEQIIAETADYNCVLVCRNLRAALREIPPVQPDVVIMDINLPDGSGIEATRRLKRSLPATLFLMFTVYEDTDQIVNALEAGASGYLLKRAASEELIPAIDELRKGGAPLTPAVARRVVESFRRRPSPPPPDSLTPREEEILQLLSKGLLAKEIAAQLNIGVETVKSHLKSIYGKLQVRSRTEAVVKYLG